MQACWLILRSVLLDNPVFLLPWDWGCVRYGVIKMTLDRVPPPAELAIYLDAFKARGGVLEFVFFDPGPRGFCPEAHRDAAWQFLDEHATACREYRNSLEKGRPLSRLLENDPYRWNESKLRGEPISMSLFWGSDDLDHSSDGPAHTDGYKSAFFLPPYGLKGDVSGNTLLFDSINSIILDSSEGHPSKIWSWSTDCSSYFDEGHEWWGAHLWTIEIYKCEMIVLVAASATD